MQITIPQDLRDRHSSIARDLLRVNGDPYAQRIVDRFIRKTEVHENGCWIVKRKLSGKGYARFTLYKQNVRVHRWTYILFKGTIPEGMELDHICRNKACVNPDHLEAVVHKENILRGDCPSAINARKTHCSKGHPFSEENTYIIPGKRRICRICRAERARKKRDAYRLKTFNA